jgi:general stress protein YciG
MAMEDRGFASMDREKQRAIASLGGKAAQATGKAHRWTSEMAQIAGRKGGAGHHKQKASPRAERGEAQ